MSLGSSLAQSKSMFVPINKYRNMRLIDFARKFPKEESCDRKLKEYCEVQGTVCSYCGSEENYWKGDKKYFECKLCRYRQSLKANTVMHGSRLPLRYWFISMHLPTSMKKSFSADGNWLYFCSAEAVEMPKDHKAVRYGLYRIAFNARDMRFGDSLECLYDAPAEGYSVSFPRISPDGRWMVFSSRRLDGLYTRPYFTYIDEEGKASKPFLLPQKDPNAYYKRLMDSYNLPAFMNGPLKMSKHRIVSEIRESPGTDVKVK